jgi:hypothetical protein
LVWTFFLQEKEAAWHQIIATILEVSTAALTGFAPVLHLAAVPKEIWTGINSVVGALFPAPSSTQGGSKSRCLTPSKSTFWLFNPRLVSVAGSQQGFQQTAFAD